MLEGGCLLCNSTLQFFALQLFTCNADLKPHPSEAGWQKFSLHSAITCECTATAAEEEHQGAECTATAAEAGHLRDCSLPACQPGEVEALFPHADGLQHKASHPLQVPAGRSHIVTTCHLLGCKAAILLHVSLPAPQDPHLMLCPAQHAFHGMERRLLLEHIMVLCACISQQHYHLLHQHLLCPVAISKSLCDQPVCAIGQLSHTHTHTMLPIIFTIYIGETNEVNMRITCTINLVPCEAGHMTTRGKS